MRPVSGGTAWGGGRSRYTFTRAFESSSAHHLQAHHGRLRGHQEGDDPAKGAARHLSEGGPEPRRGGHLARLGMPQRLGRAQERAAIDQRQSRSSVA